MSPNEMESVWADWAFRTSSPWRQGAQDDTPAAVDAGWGHLESEPLRTGDYIRTEKQSFRIVPWVESAEANVEQRSGATRVSDLEILVDEY